MNELIAVFAFILWYALALVISEKYGKNAKPNVELLFFISIIFSPIIGYLLVKIKPPTKIT